MALRLLISLGISLGLTLAIELLFALVTGKRGRDLVLVSLVNIITNPAVVTAYFLSSLYTAIHPAVMKAVLEIMAVAVEALYYKKFGDAIRRPILFSIAANAFSFGIGELISIFGG